MDNENVVGVIIFCEKTSRVLLMKRSEHGIKYGGYWSILTGHVDEGETKIEAIKRECLEEIGYGDFIFKPLFKFDGIDGEKMFFYYTLVSNEFGPILNWENEKYKWATLDNLPQPMFPGLEFKLKKTYKYLTNP